MHKRQYKHSDSTSYASQGHDSLRCLLLPAKLLEELCPSQELCFVSDRQQQTKYAVMRKGDCTPALMTDAAGFHDEYPVSCRQVVHLVGSQDASPVSQQATDASLEDVSPHMSIHCAQGVVQQGDV